MTMKPLRAAGLLLLSSSLLFASCKKDNKGGMDITMENIAGAYTYGTVKLKVTGSPEQDYTNYVYEACEKDNVINFKTDGTYTEVDAGTSCGFGDSDGTWSLSGDQMTMDGETYKVTSLNSGGLTLSSEQSSGPVTAATVYTFNRQ